MLKRGKTAIMIELSHTIAAVSTPRGKGGIAVIRVSGPDAIAVCDRIFVRSCGTALCHTASSLSVFGHICFEGEVIDDGLATVFRAPRSFTGEDTVELSCHGGMLITEAVLSAVLSAGARAAEAGEFTRRAVINGKMGLGEAESLGALLEAGNRGQLRLSRGGLEGKVEKRCRSIYDALCQVLSGLYAKIDYPDEDLSGLARDTLAATLSASQSDIQSLIDTYRSGHAIAEGIVTVICGRPNAGKSSLFNKMIGREAAIVTDVAGTTRDVLEDTVPFGGVTLRLCDTAGLRESTEDVVERIGIDRAMSRLAEAELILALFADDAPLTPEDMSLIDRLLPYSDHVIAVVSKSDIGTGETAAVLAEYFSRVVSLSVHSELGMDALANTVKGMFLDERLDIRNDPVIAFARQHAALSKARSALSAALASLDAGFPEELCAADIEAAMTALCELDGRAVSEDIVAGIFANFCVGK